MSRGGARVWGNAHPAAQLTEKRVIRYRELVRNGKATVGELAAKEGCSHGRISMAVRGETWAHLNDVAPPVSGVQRRTAAKTAPAATRGRTKTAAKSPARAAPKPAATPAAKRSTKVAPKLVAKAAAKSAAKRAAPRAAKPAARGKAAPARKAARR